MKKTLLIAALAVFTITSCSKDQVVEIPQDAIKFSVVTDNGTKAAAVYCQNNLMDEFQVFAQTNTGAGFITGDGDKIEYVDGAWQNQTAVRYWPESGSLDFYAIFNGTLIFAPSTDANAEVGVVKDFSPAEGVKEQKDLLYAVAKSQVKSGGAVEMNFRHALSQIEFRAQNLNPNLHVEIGKVKVGKVYEKGTYVLPNLSTEGPFVDHAQNSNETLNRGNWKFEDAKRDYEVNVYPTENLSGMTDFAAVYYNPSNSVNLTCSVDAEDGTRDFSKSMLLLPTVNNTDTDGLKAWEPTAGLADYNGTYLGVYCIFYNVASGTANASNIVYLNEGWAYLPVDIKWEEGKKYIYTFKFTTDGNGGYGPDPDPVDPDPILTPITYTVTVDDFEKGANTEYELEVE